MPGVLQGQRLGQGGHEEGEDEAGGKAGSQGHENYGSDIEFCSKCVCVLGGWSASLWCSHQRTVICSCPTDHSSSWQYPPGLLRPDPEPTPSLSGWEEGAAIRSSAGSRGQLGPAEFLLIKENRQWCVSADGSWPKAGYFENNLRYRDINNQVSNLILV